MEYFEFAVTETRQRIVRIEAEDHDDAERIAEELWHEGHELFTLGDSDLVVTELARSEDIVKDMLANAGLGEPIQVIVLDPGREAKTSTTQILWSELAAYELKMSQIDDEIYLVYGNGQTINRAARARDGTVSEIIFGTAFICRFDGEKLISLSKKETKLYSQMYGSPEEFVLLGDFIVAIPRSD